MEQSITPIERTFLASIDQPGLTRMSENNVGQSVTFILNSVNPNMNSTMTATIQISPKFAQMMVKCNNGSETFGDSEMSTIHIIKQGKLLTRIKIGYCMHCFLNKFRLFTKLFAWHVQLILPGDIAIMRTFYNQQYDYNTLSKSQIVLNMAN